MTPKTREYPSHNHAIHFSDRHLGSRNTLVDESGHIIAVIKHALLWEALPLRKKGLTLKVATYSSRYICICIHT
ncbi:hypothetical protein I7I53_06758 [Histoplasma capsulatum var. duboisii H88]|uniref:Uncharacterized protein n=1 Tax=Ajellomyces capsulatus (strain H88) TaxID=544711 RepID=A0A8A1LBX5_AJEC8|nr:hypothetical protein I7I53_06758 [Histoplasma capsulatum var. duboisii H88]